MKRKLMVILNFFLVICLLCGCWNKRELNDIAVVTAMAVDKKADGYLITTQVILPSEITAKGGGSRTPVVTYQSTGKTVYEATQRLVETSPRQMYLAHLRIVVFGEELAKEGIEDILDFFIRHHETRTDFFMLVAKESLATDVLKVLSHMEKIPAFNLYSSIKTAERLWAPSEAVFLNELASSLLAKAKQPVVTVVKIKGDPSEGADLSNVERIDPKTLLSVSGLAVFKKGQLVGYLNETESKGYNYIDNNITRTVGHVSCKGGNTAIELIRSHTDVKGIYTNEKPTIKINVETEGAVGEANCELDFTSPPVLRDLEKKIEQKTKQKIRLAINKAQKELNSDIFGFGEKIRRADPSKWKKIKKKWDDLFPVIAVNVKVKVKIRNTRITINSLKKQKQEQ